MQYLYRNRWLEKMVTLDSVAEWTRSGKYERRVNAARGLEMVRTEIGLGSGGLAEEWLPEINPAIGEKGAYTGLVLLSLPVATGQEALEQLRKTVNVWEQTNSLENLRVCYVQTHSEEHHKA